MIISHPFTYKRVENPPKTTKKTDSVAITSSELVANLESSKEDESRVTATKKRRTSLDGSAIATSVTVEKAKGHQKEKRKINTPFQRIKTDQVTFYDERLKDNTFVARVSRTQYHGISE